VSEHEKIDYVEFPAIDMEATKNFFTRVFGWEFKDYGSDYASFSNQGLNGGFYQSDQKATTETGSALIVFFSRELEATQRKIEDAGGQVIKPIFSFPGGRRFHFSDPSGNEYAVWAQPDS